MCAKFQGLCPANGVGIDWMLNKLRAIRLNEPEAYNRLACRPHRIWETTGNRNSHSSYRYPSWLPLVCCLLHPWLLVSFRLLQLCNLKASIQQFQDPHVSLDPTVQQSAAKVRYIYIPGISREIVSNMLKLGWRIMSMFLRYLGS